MWIFSSLDFTHIQQEVSYLALIYIGVLCAMLLDLITGVHKAITKGEATTSRGFRRTTEKAQQYLLPMMCCTFMDIICSQFLDYPFLTGGLGLFNIYIEAVSIWENTHTPKETQKAQQQAKDLTNFIIRHKDEVSKILTSK